MAKKTIKAQMKQRRDTKANWAATNPVLLDGELGIVSDDPNLYKVGDGATAWNSLPFRGFDGTLAQELGTSPNAVISQKVVSEKLTELESKDIIVKGYVTSRGVTSFFTASESENYLTRIRKVTPGERLVIYTNQLYNGWDSMTAFTNAENPFNNAQKLNDIPLKVGYNEVIVPEGATYLGMTLKFSDKLGEPDKKIIASYSDAAMVDKIKALEESAMGERIAELESADALFAKRITELESADAIFEGYVQSKGLETFLTPVSGGKYLTRIRKVTPGERLVIYTNQLYNDWESLAAFTNAENPFDGAKKLDANNITLKVGYNEVIVPEGATYIGVTIKFSDKLGEPDKKIIASYSDAAMVDKIKTLEESAKGVVTGQVRVDYAEGKIYVASPWDSTYELVQSVNYDNQGSNKNINLENAYLAQKGSYAQTTLIKTQGDDICPAYINNSYIGGNHGWGSAAYTITSTNHGKTIADVGAVYADANNVEFTILQIVDEHNIRVCSNNSATIGYSFAQPNGNLTYKSNGQSSTTIISENIAKVGNLYGCIAPSNKRAFVDSYEIISEGSYSGNTASLVESYDIYDLPSIIKALRDNRPSNGYTEQPKFYLLDGAKKLFNQSVSYKFDAFGTTLVTTTLRAYMSLNLHFHGFTQAQVISNNAQLYCPKSLPIIVGSKTYDFRKKMDWKSAPTSDILLTSEYWENADNVPDRAVMLNDNATFACGYILDRGYLANPRTDLIKSYAMHFSTARKLYPMGINPQGYISVNAGDFYSAVAYRTYYNRETNPAERTNYSVVPVGNEVYIYADYHGTINDNLSISPAWLGRKIEIIEKNDQCNIYEDVVTGEIKVESTATEDNYGYIVLKIVA